MTQKSTQPKPSEVLVREQRDEWRERPTPRKPTARQLKAAVANSVSSPAEPRAFVPLNPVLDEIATTKLTAEAAIAECDDQLWLLEADLLALKEQEDRCSQMSLKQYERNVSIASQIQREASRPLLMRRDRLMTAKAAQEALIASLAPPEPTPSPSN